MRSSLRELPPPEDARAVLRASPSGIATRNADKRNAGPIAHRFRSGSAPLPRLLEDQTAHRVSVPLAETADPSLDLPLVPEGIYERVVRTESKQADRERPDPSKSSCTGTTVLVARLSCGSSLRRLRRKQYRSAGLRSFTRQACQCDRARAQCGFVGDAGEGDRQVRGAMRELSPAQNGDGDRKLPSEGSPTATRAGLEPAASKFVVSRSIH